MALLDAAPWAALLRGHATQPARKGAKTLAHVWLYLVVVLVLSACGGGPTQPPAAPREVVQRGARLYAANCQSCHGDAVGGTVQDYPPVHNAKGHTWHHADCVLVQLTLDGMPPSPDVPSDAPRMQAFRDTLTADDVTAILAYIKTWWTDKQRVYQADVTRQGC